MPADADWNPQMMLYGLEALELFDVLYDIEIIRMTIYQPRPEGYLRLVQMEFKAPSLLSDEEIIRHMVLPERFTACFFKDLG